MDDNQRGCRAVRPTGRQGENARIVETLTTSVIDSTTNRERRCKADSTCCSRNRNILAVYSYFTVRSHLSCTETLSFFKQEGYCYRSRQKDRQDLGLLLLCVSDFVRTIRSVREGIKKKIGYVPLFPFSLEFSWNNRVDSILKDTWFGRT